MENQRETSDKKKMIYSYCFIFWKPGQNFVLLKQINQIEKNIHNHSSADISDQKPFEYYK